jgi:hypothetical protein
MTYTRYRHLAIERAAPAPSGGQLRAIEALLGAQLSASFREFLDVANGGYLAYVIDVPVGDGKTEELSFGSIFSANEGTFCDGTFVGEIRSGREYIKIPAGVLPFARDGGGSMVYLDLSTDGAGRVVAFVEGLPGWTGRRTDSQFVEIAASFDEYVDKLRIDRESVVDILSHDTSELSHLRTTEEWLDIGMPNWREDAGLGEALSTARRRIEAGKDQ